MRTPFHDRREAGRLLAEELVRYADHPDVIVLGLPRGGVAVAVEVAARLNAPLDVFVVRKLGVPGYPELAMGAIASGGTQILDEEMIDNLEVSKIAIRTVVAKESHELIRREFAYRGHKPPLDVKGKTVILVDDGIATGSTMRATIHTLRKMHPARLVIAVPVVPASTYQKLEAEVDEVVALVMPDQFVSVGEWYEDFSQLSDEFVAELLQAPHPQITEPAPMEWHPKESGWET